MNNFNGPPKQARPSAADRQGFSELNGINAPDVGGIALEYRDGSFECVSLSELLRRILGRVETVREEAQEDMRRLRNPDYD